MKIACVILAGGKSSRMQKDKTMLPFGGYKTLCEYQYNKMKELFEKVYISTKDPKKFNFKADYILDNTTEFAPTYALDSIMQNLDEDFFFVMAVDMPFLNKSVVQKLLNEFDANKDAIVATNGDEIHTLCAIYSKKIHPQIKELIKENRHKLQRFLKEIDTKYVPIDEDDAFVNLNYPHEYEEALKR
ncbi:MAG: molybdenum cofactor guanylyltransferase [Campylobacterota bacterium]|nr:molybdenum cofactor guanylyltransferase [Campylobacterota bacterium]